MEKLTVEKAIEKVENIRRLKDDSESAHGYEDELYIWFIKCIAAGMYDASEAQRIANIVKSTQDMGFERWYS